MAYPDQLLSRGERVVVHRHPHWKVLVLPAIFFVVVIAGGFALAGALHNWQNTGARNVAWIALVVVGVVLLILLTGLPVLRWRTEHFVISTAHVFFRTGIISHRQHQIPLANVQNIETDVSFGGRVLGYGSLIVESAADQPLEFENVASIGKVQATLNQLIHDARSGRGGSWDGRDGESGQFADDREDSDSDDRDDPPRGGATRILPPR